MPFPVTGVVDIHQRFSLNYMPHWALPDLNILIFPLF